MLYYTKKHEIWLNIGKYLKQLPYTPNNYQNLSVKIVVNEGDENYMTR